MAGTHQLYIYEPETAALYPSVGNGREANLNDVSLADSELAQPSGLYYAGAGQLYFADSESSTIRLADFERDLVTVVSGTTENSLFDFDDIDGELGVNRCSTRWASNGDAAGNLYIADTLQQPHQDRARRRDSTHYPVRHKGGSGRIPGTAHRIWRSLTSPAA